MLESITLLQLNIELLKIFGMSVAAFVLAMLLTPFYTYAAYRYKFWKRQRTTSTTGENLSVFTKLHAEKFKRNIPTMAGIITVIAITVVTLIANNDREQTWVPLAALIAGGAVGLIDDIINIRGLGGGVSGLRSQLKFLMITGVAASAALYFILKLNTSYTEIMVPYVGPVDFGGLAVPLFVFAIVATSNAVNISDGLDGLAGGLLATAFAVFGIIAMLQGHFGIAGFCLTVVGALLSYIWFNIYPARFFMGDIGSFALGTALGVIAMLTDTLLLLPIIALVFVVEAGSSSIQILSKRLFKRKIFLSAPIHHHFEAKGWPETKVTMRFWVLGQVAGVIGLIVAVSGGYIR